jgi:hypothetical protein
MSSQVKRIDINETSRPPNKRTPAHFPEEAQRSKRTTGAVFERGLSSISQPLESKSPTSGLKHVTSPGELTEQRGASWSDPRVATGQQPVSSPLAPAHQSSGEGQRASFPTSFGQKNLSAQALGLNERQPWGSPPSSPVNTYNEHDGGILLQPETRPITQEQLVNEVKGVSLKIVCA